MTCKAEGCSKNLRRDNKSGNCNQHRDRDREREPNRVRMAGVRKANPGSRKEESKAYYEKNSERLTQTSRKWYNEHKNGFEFKRRRNERNRNWKKLNPERVNRSTQTRRARKCDAFVENVDPSALWHRDAGLCFLCGFPAEKERWELAHIVPLSRGGEHSYANTAVSHPACNRHQSSRLLEELDIEAFLLFREEDV